MAAMLVIAMNPKIMGELVLSWSMTIVGWLATLVMLAASIGFMAL